MIFGIPLDVLRPFFPTFDDLPIFFILKSIGWLIVLWFGFITFSDKIDAGQEALLKRNGKLVYHRFGSKKNSLKIYGPGRPFLIPRFYEYWKASVLPRTIDLYVQTRKLDEHTFQEIEGNLIFQITKGKTDLALLGGDDINVRMRAIASNYFCQLIESGLSNIEISQRLEKYRTFLESHEDKLLPEELAETKQFVDDSAALGLGVLDLKVVSSRLTDSTQLGANIRSVGSVNVPAVAVMQMSVKDTGNGHQPAEVS